MAEVGLLVFARAALGIAEEALPAYRSTFSKHRFTQPQLLDEPGALVRALIPVAERGLNSSKLESRPTGGPWTYRFFADVEHTAGEARRDAALGGMRAVTRTFRVLGTYARAADAGPAGRRVSPRLVENAMPG